ncbi:hypothetical protein AB0A95_30560 [Micromonospora sp. NPDC049230]|uniref:hypothetical protein n=1 Tax=Micromonospora sp. NPDC049230 TaxID=3155502 RepID=UPI003403E9AA
MARHDGAAPPHPVLTDEPGLVLRHPRRQLAKILILYAVLPLVCSVAGAVIAYQLSNVVTERRVAALEEYLAQRRETNLAADGERDKQLEQTRRDLCVVVDRVRPRDAEVEDMRRRYGCTGGPTAAPGPPSPTPSARPRPATPTGGATGRAPTNGQRGPSGSGRVAGPTGPAGPAGPPGAPGRPAPVPSPAPPATQAPPADQPNDLLDVCVPLLRLCL